MGKEEQNGAAGGVDYRKLVTIEGKVSTASIAVKKFPRSLQHYAYVEYKTNGKTITRYVGKVTAPSGARSLKLGWLMVRKLKIVEKDGAKWLKR